MGAIDPRRRAEAQHEVQNRDRPYESEVLTRDIDEKGVSLIFGVFDHTIFRCEFDSIVSSNAENNGRQIFNLDQIYMQIVRQIDKCLKKG